MTKSQTPDSFTLVDDESDDKLGLKGLQFQNEEHEELLNLYDDMRSKGLSQVIDLPQLIVCGDQSSGKSSVLEAISGVQFPTKDDVCTRFPTELILRRSSDTAANILIIPDATRSESEKCELQKFERKLSDMTDFRSFVEGAGAAMGIGTGSKAFCKDVLRVELTGPKMPQLTLVDLPGLFHSGSKAQSKADADAVKSLVEGYMKNSRSIILAVVTAKNDYNNQVVTELAHKVDPEGNRTLGIITKPDVLHKDSPSEKRFFDLADNKDVELRLGWHVLKNRDFITQDWTIEERDRSEREFLSQGIWKQLNPRQLGINHLRSRLSKVIYDHNLTELPGMIADIDSRMEECEGKLAKLGSPRATHQEQRAYLHNISQNFCNIIKEGVAGNYGHEFFRDTPTEKGYQNRIRAIVNNMLESFAEEMRNDGCRFCITNDIEKCVYSHHIPDSPTSSGLISVTGEPYDLASDKGVTICKEHRLEAAARLITENRGIELPGFPRFENVASLYREQCSPWKRIVSHHADAIYKVVCRTVYAAIDRASGPLVRTGIRRLIVDPALEAIKKDLDSRIEQNLQHRVEVHPITLNHYFIDNVQKKRTALAKETILSRLLNYFHIDQEDSSESMSRTFSAEALADSLSESVSHTDDMSRFACEEALIYMDAYYKVAIKHIIDDFSIASIEEGLVMKLDTIFDPSKVYQLDDKTVEKIAGESKETKSERDRLLSTRDMLNNAKAELRRLESYN